MRTGNGVNSFKLMLWNKINIFLASKIHLLRQWCETDGFGVISVWKDAFYSYYEWGLFIYFKLSKICTYVNEHKIVSIFWKLITFIRRKSCFDFLMLLIYQNDVCSRVVLVHKFLHQEILRYQFFLQNLFLNKVKFRAYNLKLFLY